MMDDLAQQFEDYQEFLKISEMNLRYKTEFEQDMGIFDLLEELNDKTIDTDSDNT